MSDLPTCGSVRFGATDIPIVDCRNWRLHDRNPVCVAGLDVAACATCDARASRDGNLVDPPVFVTVAGSPTRAADAAPPPPPPEPTNWRGLGDVIASATKAIGIKPCGGCQKRREALNRAVPFRSAPVAGTSVGDSPGKASDPAPGQPGA
jgi:hypothetical protein